MDCRNPKQSNVEPNRHPGHLDFGLPDAVWINPPSKAQKNLNPKIHSN